MLPQGNASNAGGIQPLVALVRRNGIGADPPPGGACGFGTAGDVYETFDTEFPTGPKAFSRLGPATTSTMWAPRSARHLFGAVRLDDGQVLGPMGHHPPTKADVANKHWELFCKDPTTRDGTAPKATTD